MLGLFTRRPRPQAATMTPARTPAASPGRTPVVRSVVESLERRQLLAAVPLESKIKVAMLTDESTGEPLNSSRVTVRFSENIELVDASKFRMFGYAINPTSASGTAQQKVTINLLNVREGSDGNKIVFETDRRVRKGAQFFVFAGAINNASDGADIGEQNVRLPKGLNKERYTLASRAWSPTNLAFFSKEQYDAAPNLTATPNQPSANATRTALTNFLNAKVTAGTITAGERDAALARFDDATVASLVPSANLRAAIVSLVGTIAEDAIPSLLDGANDTAQPYTVIDFSNEVSASAPIAETKVNQNGRLRTLIKTSYQGESFIALSATMAHESLHQDAVNSQNEEIFTNVVETLVWAQQLAIDPSPANDGTRLVTDLNANALAFLNSGKALFPRVGTLVAPHIGTQNVFPNGDTPADGQGVYTSFENYVRRIYAARNFGGGDTPAPTLARLMANAATGRSDNSNFNFSQNRIELFDNSQQIITDRSAVQLAAILKLQVRK
jgi:hypothetical protein